MIVRPVNDGWEIIFHRGHALLAAQVALQWAQKDRIERVAETIAAIAQHDDLEREFEGDHLTAVGTPKDFTLRDRDDATEIPRWQEAIETALLRSRWVALLTAMHVLFLNAELRGSTKTLETFCQQTETNLERWRKELGIGKKEAEQSYAFLQWCDRFSLILTQGQIPADGRWLEITTGPVAESNNTSSPKRDRQRYDVRQNDDGTLTVEPWPFQTEAFAVNIDVRLLTDPTYPDNAALTRALKEAPIRVQTWQLRKG